MVRYIFLIAMEAKEVLSSPKTLHPKQKDPQQRNKQKTQITSWSWRSWTVPIWSVCSILQLHLLIQRVFSHWLSSQACLNKQQHTVPGCNRNVFYRQVNKIPNGFSCPHHEGILNKSLQIMFQSLDTKQSCFRVLWLCFGLWVFLLLWFLSHWLAHTPQRCGLFILFQLKDSNWTWFQ